MVAKVSEMTTSELKEMIEMIIEQKLIELLGDPDEGLSLRKSVRERLLRHKRAVAEGERGVPLAEVVPSLVGVIISGDKMSALYPSYLALYKSGELHRRVEERASA
jgi:hypothetical protein